MLVVTNGSRSRLEFLDVGRGCAILLVLISHFAQTFFADGNEPAARALDQFGHVATPTFVLISGTLVGFMHCTRPAASFERFRVRLADRGLFLLTVGRVLMTLALWPTMHTARYVLITDVIGVSMIVSPWLVARVAPSGRLMISGVLYGGSWILAEAWHPQNLLASTVREGLFGSRTNAALLYAFPLVPWFSVEFAASVLGDRLGDRFVMGDRRGMSLLLTRVGAASLALSAVAKGAYMVAVRRHLLGGPQSRLQELVHILTSRTKWPPAPGYLLFYGGLGVSVLAFCLLAEQRQTVLRMRTFAAVLGQNSLVMFVIQAAVYYTVLHLVRPYLPA